MIVSDIVSASCFLLLITAASKQILSLVFHDIFFANSYFFTFSNTSGSLSISPLFYPSAILPKVLLTLVRGLFQMTKIQHHSCKHHTSPESMHLYVYIKRKFLIFTYYFRPIKVFCRTMCFLILQRNRSY